MSLSSRTLIALAAAALTLAACAATDAESALEGDAGAAAEPAAATVASAPAAEVRHEFDLCQLVPVGDVAAILGETAGATVVASQKSTGGGCVYRDKEQGVPDVKVLLDFAHHASLEQATGAFAATRDMYTERGMAMDALQGLGDEAFASTEAERQGIKVRNGRYVGQVNLSAEGRDPAALRAAAQRITETVLERLPK